MDPTDDLIITLVTPQKLRAKGHGRALERARKTICNAFSPMQDLVQTGVHSDTSRRRPHVHTQSHPGLAAWLKRFVGRVIFGTVLCDDLASLLSRHVSEISFGAFCFSPGVGTRSAGC
jgi:hypothetical protein